MKRDVLANGLSGHLRIEESRVRYDREGAQSVIADYEIQPLEPGTYWVRLDGKSFRVTLGAPGNITVNGRSIAMEVFDPRDLRTAGRAGATQGRQEITAPMPGKVIRILINAGDVVEEGQGRGCCRGDEDAE
ncbi:MAG: hypothetical protein WDO18_21160 [Acidobacteriota bacterium]